MRVVLTTSEAIILCVLNLVRLDTTMIIFRVVELDLALVFVCLARLVFLFNVMNTVWSMNMLASVSTTLPMVLCLGPILIII